MDLTLPLTTLPFPSLSVSFCLSLSVSLSLSLSPPSLSPMTDQSSAADSATAFHWLQGYEKCRTGWDRFAKPQPSGENHSSHLIDLGAERGALRTGFPETWPWSHIITPNSDGKTEIASESLLCVISSLPRMGWYSMSMGSVIVCLSGSAFVYTLLCFYDLLLIALK